MALDIFRMQYEYNKIYKTYVDTLGVNVAGVNTIENIPFLPIQFFKSDAVTTTEFKPEIIFESSGTTGENTSRHFIKRLSLYKKSFTKGFNLFYGQPGELVYTGLIAGLS